MELKPEKKNEKIKYPNEDEINNVELNRPLEKWKKIGITAAVLGTLGIMVAHNLYLKEITAGIMQIDTNVIFNSKFKSYEGKRKGTEVKSLITTIYANNAQFINDINKTITINQKETTNILEYCNSILDEELYEVELEYNEETGLIKNINIKQVKETLIVNEIKEENKVSLNKRTQKDFIEKIEEIIKWANHNGLA